MKFFKQKEKQLLETNPTMWQNMNELPKSNGVYMICHIGFPYVVYIGESKNLWDRFWKHHRTGNCSSFRQNLFKCFKNDKKDLCIEQFLNECVIKFIELNYGRKELEEYLISKYCPKFNRLGINVKSKIRKS